MISQLIDWLTYWKSTTILIIIQSFKHMVCSQNKIYYSSSVGIVGFINKTPTIPDETQSM